MRGDETDLEEQERRVLPHASLGPSPGPPSLPTLGPTRLAQLVAACPAVPLGRPEPGL